MLNRAKIKAGNRKISGAGNGGRRLAPPAPPITDILGVIKAMGAAFAATATWIFVDCAKVSPEVARAKDRLPHFVFLKVKQPIEPTTITPGAEAIKLPFGRLHHLSSAGLTFGYMLELQRLNVIVRPTIITVMRQTALKTSQFTDATMIQQTPHISVFFSEDGAMLVGFNEQHRNLSAETLRGSPQG